ncbi:c-type cytochrome [Pseudoalteromonas sp. MMG013]|uniref:cytochrome-c peroxidase n=1 Tax=Pseudoalteromonas sp. MMG013 TaxID=2822687 RepID=UPI001B39B5FA|nr:c-type cytochrome [Pseudoalteromonas sp. MMG013]
MKNNYAQHMAYMAIVTVLIIAGYAWLKLANDSNAKLTPTSNKPHFEFITVNGPIQPIPAKANFDQAWVQLGKSLFNSKLLSDDNTVSCASCHLVDYGGDDGFALSTGVNNALGERNSPTVLNAVFNFRQFWDGRSTDLFEQVAGPIHSPVEMNSNWQQIIGKLNNEPKIKQAFKDLNENDITQHNISKAITIYQSSLITPNSAFDRFILGNLNALTAQQKRGWNAFQELGCISCHQGRNIGGNMYQKLGRIDEIHGVLKKDLGRYNVTKNPNDKHIFKVPSLRNVALTAPYFHNGSVATLDEAVTIMAKIQLGTELSAQTQQDIVSLLHAFSSEGVDHDTP